MISLTYPRFALALALAAGLSVLPIRCQAAPESGGPPASSPAPAAIPTAGVYPVGPGDTLDISVINFTDLNAKVSVLPDGTISLPLIGAVNVGGSSTDEIARILTKRWNKYVVDPVVSVSVSEKHPQNFYVYGLVGRPGPIEYTPDLRLLEGIAEAGGVAPGGDLANVTVTHPDGRREVLDVSDPGQSSGTTADIPLQPGDLVYVAEAGEVSVIGEVVKPGGFDYKPKMTLLDAISMAEGVKDTADLQNTTLTHAGKTVHVDLLALLKHGDKSANVPVSPGDQINVPEIGRIYVFGEVGRPGFYPYKQGDRLLDALDNAGGPSSDADVRKISYVHIDPTRTVAVVRAINLDNYFKKGDLTTNCELQAGDAVFVPKRRDPTNLSNLWGVLQGVSLLTSVGRIF
ncbi:MAG: SLBB domain-containing protein [Capsulimonadaceae bacterium]